MCCIRSPKASFHALFLLGSLTKAGVRKIADEIGLVTSNKPDSQDICFVKDGKYAEFIENTAARKGAEADTRGNILGT